MHKIYHANIKEWAKNYDGPLFDGILCDPPYELGFMGKSWDSSGIAFDTEMWSDIYRLLKPGAHLLAFSGSRTYHRMAVAIEDAGFEIRDQIMWVYGSGFPKSRNIGLDVDKRNGVTKNRGKAFVVAGQSGQRDKDTGGDLVPGSNTMGAYVAQNEWSGWGTALKPAHEPCVLARKPIEGTVANNVLKHGTGGLNIDGTRVGVESIQVNRHSGYNSNSLVESTKGKWKGESEQVTGRFPANLIHDGSDEVEAVFPDSKSGSGKATEYEKHGGQWGKGKQIRNADFGDSGSASRFFYTAKASKRERNAGLEGFKDRLGGSLEGGNDKRKGDRPQLQPTKNHHPTVKPLSLTKYLATLIKPPTGGRLLVPFSGSGSEMIGALQAGWEYVEGVELTEEYIPIAEARIIHWIAKQEEQDKVPVQQTLIEEVMV